MRPPIKPLLKKTILVLLAFGAYWSRVIAVVIFFLCLFQITFSRLLSTDELCAFFRIVFILTCFMFIIYFFMYWLFFMELSRRRRK